MTHTSTTWVTYCFLPLITSFTFANGFVNTTEMWLANLWLLATRYRTTKIRLSLKAVMFSNCVIGEPVTFPLTGLPRCERGTTLFLFSKYCLASRRIVVSSSVSSSRRRLLGLLQLQEYRCENLKSRIILLVT